MIERQDSTGCEELAVWLQQASRQADAARELRLGDILARYRDSLNEVDWIDLDAAGEFVALASRVLLQQSAWLLAQPAEDTGEDISSGESVWLEPGALAELALQMRSYEGHESLAGPVNEAVEPRTEPRPASLLARAWRDMMTRRAEPAVPVHVPAFVRLESAVSSLIRRLKTSIRVPFMLLVEGGSRPEVVVQFLAMLELVRRRTARVEQDELFAEMTIEYAEDSQESAARAG